MDSVKWLVTACAKDYRKNKQGKITKQSHAPILTAPYLDAKNQTTIGCDGRRMHVIHSAVNNIPEPIGNHNGVYPNYEYVLQNASVWDDAPRAIISKYHLEQALKSASAFTKENKVKLSMNGSLVISAQSEDGDMTCAIVAGDKWYTKKAKSIQVTYQHEGPDIETAFDYKYMLEALAGMPDLVEYRQGTPKSGIYLSGKMPSGEMREAVIMPMQWGK